MLVIEVGAAVPGGYVRAVFSRKAGGFVAPLDLVRAQLGAAAKLALRARMRAAFADYLASDDCPDDAALRELEYISRPAFSESRERWRGHVERMAGLCGTASYSERARPEGGLREGFDCGALDAPSFVPGGAALWREYAGGFVGSVVTLREGYWR